LCVRMTNGAGGGNAVTPKRCSLAALGAPYLLGAVRRRRRRVESRRGCGFLWSGGGNRRRQPEAATGHLWSPPPSPESRRRGGLGRVEGLADDRASGPPPVWAGGAQRGGDALRGGGLAAGCAVTHGHQNGWSRRHRPVYHKKFNSFSLSRLTLWTWATWQIGRTNSRQV
jgi:hypothetical protein